LTAESFQNFTSHRTQGTILTQELQNHTPLNPTPMLGNKFSENLKLDLTIVGPVGPYLVNPTDQRKKILTVLNDKKKLGLAKASHPSQTLTINNRDPTSKYPYLEMQPCNKAKLSTP
jgi:hypothetical protein